MEQITVKLQCKNEKCKRESTVEVYVLDEAEIEQTIEPNKETLEPYISDMIICEFCGTENLWDRIHRKFL